MSERGALSNRLRINPLNLTRIMPAKGSEYKKSFKFYPCLSDNALLNFAVKAVKIQTEKRKM